MIFRRKCWRIESPRNEKLYGAPIERGVKEASASGTLGDEVERRHLERFFKDEMRSISKNSSPSVS